MEEVIKIIYDMDYDFDDTKVQPKSQNTLVQSTPVRQIAVLGKEHRVGTGRSSVKVDRLLTSSSASTFNKMNMDVTVSFNKVPRGIYEVYLNVPSGEVPHPSSKYFVGFMNFFGYDDKMQGKSCRKGCCTPLNVTGRPYTNFYYELSKESVASGEYNVTIYKHNQVSSDMIIDNIKITGR
jgi:hypothetical protein